MNGNFLPQEFYQFIAPNVNRREFLCRYLESLKIDYRIIPLDGKNHIYIKFPPQAYNPTFKIKTLLVHYDRFEPSPGANDNSAAIFQVINWIRQNRLEMHNMRIFFTDGEELGFSGAKKQGAFALAQVFKRLGIVNDDVYVLDCCGAGDVLVVSTAGKKIQANTEFAEKFDSLFARTTALAKSAAPSRWVTAPIPYGDNAGFIASGIPAILVSVLPSNEATTYLAALQNKSGLSMAELKRSADFIPKTWQRLHTKDDNAESLTPKAFELMQNFLNALAKSKKMS